ncbi:CAF1-domain-containing protein [Neocallimastix californiae]|uniref:Poly(A)-specific ribonuclease PARN n=1 Tax=Neocallimastix californiae TaxID=1754190 RepID=A0A1Y2DRD2_9FUNG|nr:CAF1-domain-containing protein [Neocallimastix californiae]|eukprot:ORY61830.1 CAF1-domain-containing protein [Neocallimastix californiae]
MEINKHNFELLLPTIREAIDESQFVSVDFEFTGLKKSNDQGNFYYDTLQDRYEKARNSAKSFLVPQCGICTFYWDDESKKYKAKAFNFYCFPATGSRELNISPCFLCEGKSLEFLMQNGFNFNEWIEKGIPFLRSKEENQARERLNTLFDNEIKIDERNKEFYTQFKTQLDDFLQNSTEKSILVKAPNRYLKKIIHQQVRKLTNGFVASESASSEEIRLTKLTEEEKYAYRNKEEKLADEINDLIGFRKVIDYLILTKKPIVGHNMLLDICHMVQSFHSDLPHNFTNFQKRINTLFPTIFDTKYIIESTNKLREMFVTSTLIDAKRIADNNIRNCPEIDLMVIPDDEDITSKNYENLELCHEAGFDAYITGILFIKLSAFLENMITDDSEQEKQLLEYEPNKLSIGSNQIYKKYKNRVFIMQSDMAYISTAKGKDDIIDRSNVFYAYNYPPSWRIPVLIKTFEEGIYGGVHVCLDQNSSGCFVKVFDRKMVSFFKQKWMNEEIIVVPYSEYQKTLEENPELKTNKKQENKRKRENSVDIVFNSSKKRKFEDDEIDIRKEKKTSSIQHTSKEKGKGKAEDEDENKEGKNKESEEKGEGEEENREREEKESQNEKSDLEDGEISESEIESPYVESDEESTDSEKSDDNEDDDESDGFILQNTSTRIFKFNTKQKRLILNHAYSKNDQNKNSNSNSNMNKNSQTNPRTHEKRIETSNSICIIC